MLQLRSHCHSPLGLLEIHSDGEAITAVRFSNAAGFSPDQHPLLESCRQQLQEYFEGTRRVFDLPLRQPGTAFQQRVWEQLGRIEYGKTVSYLELAARLGDIRATRAVGFSNGKNALAVIVPCHRVIGSDGSLTGYAGGKERKKWLLTHEARFAQGVQTVF